MTNEIVDIPNMELVKANIDPLPPELSNQCHNLILYAGDKTGWRFTHFFVKIRNDNTREAYYRAVMRCFDWCERTIPARTLQDIKPHHIATYIEWLEKGLNLSKPTIKQHLAAIRKCFDHLVTGNVGVEVNPASSVDGPKHKVKKGKTPHLDAADARLLIDSIPRKTKNGDPIIVGLRDRALIGTMLYTFGRISAVIGMNVEDYYLDGRRRMFRLNEKGGTDHAVPAHHNAMDYLEEYLDITGLWNQPQAPLFQSVHRTKPLIGQLTGERFKRQRAYEMMERRARAAGIETKVSNHTWRTTGITNYLLNKGTLEHAQLIAAHASVQTTKLYDRSKDEPDLDEIERIVI